MELAKLGILLNGGKVVRPRIAGRRTEIEFPPSEAAVQAHEFYKILIGDCYALKKLGGRIATVLDIGANAGLFSLAVRHRFRDAVIHAYEPNPEVYEYLNRNVDKHSVVTFNEAVGAKRGSIDLVKQSNSLHTVAELSEAGNIRQIAFTEALGRFPGFVDLLKLDCEGAEWEILHSDVDWDKVRNITMEYHLWARPGSSLNDLQEHLDRIGFRTVALEESKPGAFGMLQATRAL